MRINRQNLDIIFRKISPESICASILLDESILEAKENRKLNSSNIPKNLFMRLANEYEGQYSRDERALAYEILTSEMKNGPFHDSSVFNLLYSFSNEVLTTNRYIPLCKYKEILKWQDTTHKLGQNLFTTVFLAVKDAEVGTMNEVFTWEAILKNDNVRLQEILSAGIAENHYHLKGSTQSFPINWVLSMNHPETIFHADIWDENMTATSSFSSEDNILPWSVKLFWAAAIRQYLFAKIYYNSDESTNEARAFQLRKALKVLSVLEVHAEIPELIKNIQILRFLFGAIAEYDRSPLDYAVLKTMKTKNKNHNRILAGERNLMYQCFRSLLSKSFSKFDSDVFYLYLSIKSNFRSELIQNNGEIGFQNFSDYQARKGLFFDDDNIRNRYPDYSDEALRFSLQGVLSEQPLHSLEARIMPKPSQSELAETIKRYDKLIDDYLKSTQKNHLDFPNQICLIKKRKEKKYFFVIHYPKSKYIPKEVNLLPQARNQKERDRNAKFTRALFLSLSKDPYMRDAILGIDTCANEIGCRPETFATDFRFLRTVIPQNKNNFFSQHENPAQLNFTYHVGEDFLDVVDGLRAIDECILFLGMKQGDRFGHALALGIDVDDYYHLKCRRLIMPKQDILDNNIWLLFRANELGISISPKLEMNLKNQIYNEMLYIYGSFAKKSFQYPIDSSVNMTLNPPDNSIDNRIEVDHRGKTLQQSSFVELTPYNYYRSWKLRGDSPELYKKGYYEEAKDNWGYNYKGAWKNVNLQADENIRKDKNAVSLYYAYHYDSEVKRKGTEIAILKAEDEYIALVKAVQKKMQFYVAEKGIMIECNPTSNFLIGTIDRYDKHPITVFNNLVLETQEDAKRDSAQLSVSINTDDQGVFDTLICNEYAIMAAALERKIDANGNNMYTASQVYQYLDSVRKMGLEQSFMLKKSTK